MNLKKFLKNMNRGIALLVVVIIAFVGYVVYDNTSFKKETPQIEALMEEYFGKIPNMNLLPEAYRTYGKAVPKSVIDEKIKENDKIIDQYWTEKKLTGYYGSDKADIKQQLKETIHSMQSGDGVILAAELGFKEVSKIQKTSPTTADVEVTFYSSFDAIGNCMVYNGTYPEPIIYSAGYYSKEGEEVQDGKARNYKTTDIRMEFTLAKTADGWKIAATSGGYSSGGGSVTIIGEDTSDGTENN